MSLQTQKFGFEQFVLDVREKALFRDGEDVQITPKGFQLLLVLVENHGHLVEKEALMNEVWPNSFVEEGNLTFTIRKLRVLLNDDPQKPTFIETVPRRGYRFIANVRHSVGRNEKWKTGDSARKADFSESPLSFVPHTNAFEGVHPSGAVVAFADWPRDETNPHESPADFPRVPPDPKIASLELLPDRRPRDRPHRKRYLYILTGLICVVSVGFGLYYFFNRNASSNAFRMSNLTRLTSNGKTKLAAAGPNGEFIAYILDDEGQQSLWLKNVVTGSDTQILPPAEDTSLQNVIFAPDGNHLYYAAKGALYRLPLLGGLPKKLITNLGIRSDYSLITFSPDGKQFTFIRHLSESESVIIIADADGTKERILASSKRPEIFLRSAAWSPDGKVIAVIIQAVEGNNKIVAVRVAGGVVSSVPSPHWSLISQIAWQPDGDSLLVVATEGSSSISHQIWALSYPGGEAQNITNDLNNYQSISLTADGRGLVAVRIEQVSHIWAMSGEETNQARQLTRGIDNYDGIFGLNFLSDGRIIYESTPGGKGEVWTMDADGRGAKQLVDESGSTCSSPDGKYLVFQSTDAEGVGLFRLDLSSGEKKPLTKGADTWATFSPDGKWIVYTRWAEQIALWKVSVDGGEAVRLTSVSGYPTAPAISPDGKFIAFHWATSERKQRPEIAIIPFDGGEVIKTFELPVQYGRGYSKNTLQWTPDGLAISYAVFRNNVSNVWQQPVDGSPPTQVTNFESGQIFNFAFWLDGKQIALARGTYSRDAVLVLDP